jgi:hypothetical protein
MSRAAVALTLLSFFSALGLAAQGPWPVDLGQRVRVQTDAGAWIGTITYNNGFSLTLDATVEVYDPASHGSGSGWDRCGMECLLRARGTGITTHWGELR